VVPVAPTPLTPLRPLPAAAVPSAPGTSFSERRPRARAVTVSVVCSLLGPLVFLVSFGSTLEAEPAVPRPWLWAPLVVVDVCIGLVACALVGVHRRSTAGGLALAASMAVSSWAGPAAVVGVVRLGRRRSLPLDVGVVTLVVAGGSAQAYLLQLATGVPAELHWLAPLVAVAVAALLLWGRVRETRAALVESLRRQAATAERERAALTRTRDADVARTRAEERSAIARDMHDTLSHQLSVVALHAGALAHREDLPPERVREAARTVRDAAAEANGVLREVLTALRSTDPGQRLGHHGGAEPPTSVGATAARARTRGQDVVVRWEGLSASEVDERSPATAVSLAQVTGELLVNAGKHAPGAPVEVALAHEDDDLVLRVTNPLVFAAPALGTGLGLVGVAERARLLGGTARHGVADGRFRVEVRLPWTP